MTMRIRIVLMVLLIVGAFALVYVSAEEEKPVEAEEKESKSQETLAEVIVPSSPIRLEVVLRRVYFDGETSEESIEEEILAMEDFWSKYSGWNLQEMDQGHIVFQKRVNDISPLLKANGYFGVTKEGTLSIFNGKPVEDEVIQSFYQLDLYKLESVKQKQLQQGIRIRTKQQYEEVLETFKPYSRIDMAQ